MTQPADLHHGSDDSSPPGDPELRELLKHCSAGTYRAAVRFRRTGHARHLAAIVNGVVAHHVGRDLHPRLYRDGDSLRLTEDLGLDSLTQMEMALLTEDVLRISIDNDALGSLRTLGDFRRLVAARAAGPSRPAASGSWTIRPKSAPAA